MKAIKCRIFVLVTLFFLFVSVPVWGDDNLISDSFEERVISLNGVADMMKVHNGNYFIRDQRKSSVFQYSKNFKLLGTFGKKGEGPGELTELNGFDFAKNRIYLQSRAKLAFFSLDGKLVREIKKIRPSYFLILKNGNLIEKFTEYGAENRPGLTVDKFFLCTPDFKRRKLLAEERELKNPGMPFKDFINKMEIKYCEKTDTIIISQRNKGFLFIAYDSDGKLLFNITDTKLKKLKVTEKFKNDFKEELLSDPRMRSNPQMAKQLMKRIKYSAYFPPFHSFYLDEKGNIFIRTYQRKDELLLYKKYSWEGKFIGNLWIKDENPDIYETRNIISFFNDKMFCLKESEDGEYILSKTEVR